MADVPPIVLRYFDCRGRAQFLRHYLASRDFEYVDERLPLSPGFAEWQAMRDDGERAGAFRKLPVLHCGNKQLSEALVIQAYLHRVSGDEGLLSESENARHAMLVSSLYHDVMTPIGVLIWVDLMYSGVNIGLAAQQSLARMRTHLASLDRTLDEWDWCEKASSRPIMLADCLLWEQIDVARHVFGEHLELFEFATLTRVYRESAGRKTFQRLLSQPVSVTGRGVAGEAETLAGIRRLLAEAK